jgi:antitoxin (DNA-binding transcriptional repressor) of toxin-antitoxin stability system
MPGPTTIAHYGPITATYLARHASAVLREVRLADKTFPVAIRGEVVAVIRPIRPGHSAQSSDHGSEVSTRQLARSGPSPTITAAQAGHTTVLTYHNRPFATVIPPSAWTELTDLFADAPVPDGATHSQARK